MTERPFTDAERQDVAEMCQAFAKENRLRVTHKFDKPDSVWFSITDGARSVASGTYTAEIDRAPSFVNARFATYLTLRRMWFK